MSHPITLDDYKLSRELIGHDSDVRGVAQIDDGIASVSRDKTTKVWIAEKESDYNLYRTLTDHTNFVSSICYLHELPLICTGSNDSTISVYCGLSFVKLDVLEGHQSAVCVLSRGPRKGTLMSGSWDQTARLWTVRTTGSSTFVALVGHEAAVWAVTAMKPDRIVTGSADKNIIFWDENGEKIRVFKGHTDCVRGLIALDNGNLISCGNDALIKCWNDDGECINELSGHENYIYAITMHQNCGENLLVSASEDSTIRMWDINSGQLGKSLRLPAQSVWAVACLPNGDIVTGTSDGIVRIFTKDPKRVAPPEVLQAFETAVNSRKEESSKMLGGIKHDDLPGPEALEEPAAENAIRVIKHADGLVRCHQFIAGQWTVVGDVLGASGGTQNTSGKKLFEGKEYDYVFDVDISDNAPAIKLPYNRDEDPWLAAQKFIHKHELPQVYLEQVANFIIKNADTTPALQVNNSGYVDPFTGAARYVPGAGVASVDVTGNADPFTGASSYVTKESRVPQVKPFPHSTFMTFDSCDVAKVRDKLKEFNAKTGDNNISVSDELIEAVIKLTNKDAGFDKLSVEALQHLLMWPKEILFPVLDVTRLAARNEQICHALLTPNFLANLIENLSSIPANQLMSTRCLSNMIIHAFGSQHVDPKLREIIEAVTKIKQGSVNLQIAIATLLLNMSIWQIKLANLEKCHVITEGILEFFQWVTDLEAAYRAMQALGNITCTPFGTETAALVASLDSVAEKIRQFATTEQPFGFEKVTKCAQALALTF